MEWKFISFKGKFVISHYSNRVHFQGNFFQCFQSRNEELLCNLTLWLYSTFGVRSVMCFGRRWYVHCFLDVHLSIHRDLFEWTSNTFFQMLANYILLTRESFHLQKFSLNYCNCSVTCCGWVGWRKPCEYSCWLDLWTGRKCRCMEAAL